MPYKLTASVLIHFSNQMWIAMIYGLKAVEPPIHLKGVTWKCGNWVTPGDGDTKTAYQ